MSVNNFVNRFTYKERRHRKLQQYLLKKQQYCNMSKDELEMRYIAVLSKFEHKKLILLTIMSTIFISILSDVWKYFFNMIGGLMSYMYNSIGENELVQTTILVTIVLGITVMGVMLVILIIFFHDIKTITEEKIFLERLINNHND